jgi:hypothetical protein
MNAAYGENGSRIVHEKEPEMRRLLLVTTLVSMLNAPTAQGHSWYDPDCCSGQDCDVVTDISFVTPDPKSVPIMVVANRFGKQPVTSKTKIRESKDGRMHACIYEGELLCLYLPPGQ